MNFYHLNHSSILLFMIFFITSCGHNSVSENEDDGRISGFYKSIVFTTSGPTDG